MVLHCLFSSERFTNCDKAIMVAPSLVFNRLLSRDAVDLGRFVLQPKIPEQDFFPPPIASTKLEPIIGPNDIIVQHHYDFSHILHESSGTRFNIALTELLGLQSEAKDTLRTRVDAVRRTTYTLSNSQAVFERICASSDRARRYLEKAYLRNRKVYLVVGLETLLDADIKELAGTASKRDGNLTAPGGLIATAATGVPLPLGDILDVGVGAGWSKGKKTYSTFFAEGEQIYAVQYRQVEFRWFSRGKVAEEATLKDQAVWKSFWTRGGAEEPQDAEDSVMANVNHELKESDISDVEVVESDNARFYFAT
jgi:hypothetical protein